MKVLGIALGLTLGVTALAEDGLRGKWTIGQVSCSSGQPNPKRDASLTADISGSAEFTDADLTTTFDVEFKMAPNAFEEIKKNLQQSIESLRAQPDGKGKAQSLTELETSLKTFEGFERGVKCTSREKAKYTLDGDTMHIEKSSEHSSTCPGAEADRDGGTSTIQLSGDTLKVTEAEAESSENGYCAKGDHSVMTLTRAK